MSFYFLNFERNMKMNKREMYKKIFFKLVVIDDKKSKKTFCVNEEETASNFKLLFGIKEKEIIDAILSCKYIRGTSSYPVKSDIIYCVLDYILVRIKNNSDFQTKLDLAIFQKIAEIYNNYQTFKMFCNNLLLIEKGTVLQPYPIIQSIKQNSGFDFTLTPEQQLDNDLKIIGLQLLTDVLVNQGLAPLVKLLDIKNNDLAVTDINEQVNNLPVTSGNSYHNVL